MKTIRPKYGMTVAMLFMVFCAMAEMNSSWYEQNQNEIDQLRKGEFRIEVLDEQGKKMDAVFTYELVKHEFPWGTALAFGSGNDEDWYRAMARHYFNCGVTENAFKWSLMQPNPGPVKYTDVNAYVGWANSIGWELRGHTLLWGSQNYEDFHPLMKWVKDLPIAEQLAECQLRIEREMAYYKGKIKEYDVMNEATPGHADYLQRTVGDSINWNCFKWARKANPDAKLYINDYNVVSYNDTYKYKALIQKIVDQGGEIDGIGVQGHFGGSLNPNTIKSKLNTLSTLGIPIKVTEFDMQVGDNNISEAKQADYYAQAMRTFFAHPNVNGFLFWGFWDQRHWRNGAGIFDKDKMPKIAADSVYHLIHQVWHSKGVQSVSAGTTADIHVYYGNYEFEVDVDGVKKVVTLPLTKDKVGQMVTVDLRNATLRAPQLVKVKAIDARFIKLRFDDEIEMGRRQHAVIKVFGRSKKTTQYASQPENDSSIVLIRMKDEMANSDYLTAAYIPGEIEGKNGMRVKFSGSMQIQMMIPEFESAYTNQMGDTINLDISQALETESVSDGNTFILNVNGVQEPVLSAQLNPVNTKQIQLLPQSPVDRDAEVTVSYSTGNIYTMEGGRLSTFGDRAVTNNVATSLSEIYQGALHARYEKSNAQIAISNSLENQENIHFQMISLNGKYLTSGQVGANQIRYVNAAALKNSVIIVVFGNAAHNLFAQKIRIN